MKTASFQEKQEVAGNMLCGRYCLRPKALFGWADKYNIDLIKLFKKIANKLITVDQLTAALLLDNQLLDKKQKELNK